jgi:dynein heavy chain
MQISIDEQFQLPVRDMCMMFHQQAASLAVAFLQEQQRYIYVTPTSYLELLATYKELLMKKRQEIDTVRNRYAVYNYVSLWAIHLVVILVIFALKHHIRLW